MPLLDLQTIRQNRTVALQKANQPMVSTVSTVQGLPQINLNAIATPPAKKVFTIFSWNIRDYKGSKITPEKGKDQNPFVNQFVKVVAEEVKADLMMIIETDVDLTEAVAEIESSPQSQFGFLLTSPPPKKSSPLDPRDDESIKRDDDFWKEVKKRVEALSEGGLLYWPFGSEMAFRRVNLPATFTFADLQRGILKSHPNEAWWENLEAVGHCYDAYYQNALIRMDSLIQQVPSLSSFKLNADYQFRLRTICPNCGGMKRLPSTQRCDLCGGSRKAMDYDCANCKGAKQIFANVTCTACNGAKGGMVQCSGCGGSGACAACGGNGVVVCHFCGGPVRVVCNACQGTGIVNGSFQCGNCNGAGGGFLPPNCQACSAQGFLLCSTCNGSKACGQCGGAKSVAVLCNACQGSGQVLGAAACAPCGGSGVNPKHICGHCKGLGKLACASCPGQSCTACGGSGATDCPQCSASGLLPSAVCTRCDGTGTEGACPRCAGTGSFDPDAEDHVLQTLRDLLTPESFSNIDVETYTLLWRKGSVNLPPRIVGGRALAADDKAVWLDANNVGLCSKDRTGNEIGYQDPASKFNSRSPYVIPLYLDINGKKRQLVPVVLFHAIWGEVTKMKTKDKTELVKDRAASVEYLQLLGVQSDGGTIAVNAAPGSILVGDFNLDYMPTGKSRDKYSSEAKNAIQQVFQNLGTNGYIAPVGGTQTGLTPLKHGIERLQKPGGKDIHTYAYDNFWIKGADLQANIANCGVFDVLSLLRDRLAADSNLVSDVDKDAKAAGFTLNDHRTRAFYIYYKYISDHLPIILDILVDEIDPQYKKWIEEQKQYILSYKPPPVKMDYFGEWTALAPDNSEAAVSAKSPQLFEIVGTVVMVWYPNLVGLVAGELIFFGAWNNQTPTSDLIGKTLKGTFELGRSIHVMRSKSKGAWAAIAISPEKGFALEESQAGLKLRGRLTSVDANGNVAVTVKTDQMPEAVVLNGPGALQGSVAMGAWVEGIYIISQTV